MKKLLVTLMCIVMVISLIPTFAFANTSDYTINLYYVDRLTGEVEGEPVHSVGVNEGQNFNEALWNYEYGYSDFIELGYQSHWQKGEVVDGKVVYYENDNSWLDWEAPITEDANYYLRWDPVTEGEDYIELNYSEDIVEGINVTEKSDLFTILNHTAMNINQMKHESRLDSSVPTSDDFVEKSVGATALEGALKVTAKTDDEGAVTAVDFSYVITSKLGETVLATFEVVQFNSFLGFTIDLPDAGDYSYYVFKDIQTADWPEGIMQWEWDYEGEGSYFELYEYLGEWEVCLGEFEDDPEDVGGEYTNITLEDFLAMETNGRIELEENLRVGGVMTVEKDLVIDLNEYRLEFDSDSGEPGIYVSKGTLTITGMETEYGDVAYLGVTNGSHAVVIDGATVDSAKVELDRDVIIGSDEEPILINCGTLVSCSYFGLTGQDEDANYYMPFKVLNKNKAKVELTGGFFHHDMIEYVASGYTMGAWVNNPYEDVQELMYFVMKKPTNDKELEEAVYNEWVAYKDDKGYYYEDAAAVKLANVKAEKFASWVTLDITDEYGICRMGDRIPVMNNGTIEKWYELSMGVALELPEFEGYHFAGWYEATYADDGSGKAIYSNKKVEVTDPITKDLTIATKWCNGTKTTVVGKTEATYAADGYTGDTVCDQCGLVYEKGQTIPKLLKVEEQKVEVTEKVVEEVVKDATSSKADTVVIPLADAKEEIKVVELPTKAVEKVVESGKSLTVETPTATVTLDNKALETVIAKAEGAKIELQIEAVEETELLPAQKDALKDVKADLIISAEIVCATTGKEISKDFGGGKATVALPFQAEAGTKLEDYVVIYIADDGTIQKVPTKVVDGKLVFDIEHFSEYAVVKKEVVKDIPFVNGTPETGDTNSILPWIVLMVATATGITVLKKKEN